MGSAGIMGSESLKTPSVWNPGPDFMPDRFPRIPLALHAGYFLRLAENVTAENGPENGTEGLNFNPSVPFSSRC